MKILSIIADLITIATVIIAIPLAFLKRKQNLLAFRISNFLHYLLRLAFIVFAGTIIFELAKFIYFLFLLPFQGEVNDSNFYWKDGEEIPHLISYFISGAIGLSIGWIATTFLWTSSWNSAKGFFNLFLPKGKLLIMQKPVLEILSAIYKTNAKEVDVTQVARKMISDNRLTIKASNDLAGDPDYGIPKTLVVNYRFGSKTQEVITQEGGIIDIPA